MKSTDQKLHEQVMGLCFHEGNAFKYPNDSPIDHECYKCKSPRPFFNPSYTTDTPKGCYFDLLKKVEEPGLWNAFYEGYIIVTYDALPPFKPTFAMWLFMLMTDTHRGSEAIAEFFCKEGE